MNSLTGDLQCILNAVISSDKWIDSPIFGAQLAIESEDHSIRIQSGFLDGCKSTPICSDSPIRIASNTKTIVAAAVLKLWEEGILDLDKSLEYYLSKDYCKVILSGGYCLERMCIRHLLTHTSGLFDYADCSAFERQYRDSPQHVWSRFEQLDLAIRYGEPYGRPGDVVRYSDTGYILLGQILENVTGLSLGTALRNILSFSALGLDSTWLELDEVALIADDFRAHQYVGKTDFFYHNASYDIFGGGGLISTVGDIALFMKALFDGRVYSNKKTLETMLTSVIAERGGPPAYGNVQQIPGVYRMGLEAVEIPVAYYGHGGFLGTYAGYCPSLKAAFCFSVNQHESKLIKEQLCKDILTKLMEF